MSLRHNTQIHPNTVRQVFFICLLVFLGYLIVSQLYFMLGAFLGAITLYVILMHPMKYLVVMKNWKPWVASLILMILSLIIMVIPIGYLTSVAIERIMPVINNPAAISGNSPRAIGRESQRCSAVSKPGIKNVP